MYRWLLCWRYLKTRYIALASIISVTLGVATMIVVNSVMLGFTHEMQNRLHGILSDLIFQSRSLEGFPDPDWHMEQIRRVAGDAIEAMTPTVVVPGMLNYQVGDAWMTRPVQIIGVDERTQAQVSDFSKYLQHPENRKNLSFNLREGGYDVIDHQADGPSLPRDEMALAGWEHRRRAARLRKMIEEVQQQPEQQPPSQGAEASPFTNPFERAQTKEPVAAFDPETSQYTGAILGIGLASFRRNGQDHFLLLPGDDVKLTLPTVGTPPRIVSDTFTVVDFYESKMSEYDANFVFVPIRVLQQLRGMIDPSTGKGYVNAISIKLKPGADMNEVRDRLRNAFAPQYYAIDTWRDSQGPLLAAVNMETAILNVLLFLIICVAGFGILAIFFMIVVEKTRDIGILKALGASAAGVMSIFLGYGLLLGVVGAGAGLTLGLLFVRHINEIADLLGRITGHRVFDPDIYYFYKIPTIVDPWTVGWIMAGAMLIAVLASVLPALRAARLHPVEALRYE
ncbi:MAG: ABC transporter permease [Thermogutta sp.]